MKKLCNLQVEDKVAKAIPEVRKRKTVPVSEPVSVTSPVEAPPAPKKKRILSDAQKEVLRERLVKARQAKASKRLETA